MARRDLISSVCNFLQRTASLHFLCHKACVWAPYTRQNENEERIRSAYGMSPGWNITSLHPHRTAGNYLFPLMRMRFVWIVVVFCCCCWCVSQSFFFFFFLSHLNRTSLHLYPVHGRHADVLRAGKLRVWTFPARFFTPRPAVLLRPNRRLHHRLLLSAGGVLQVRLMTIRPCSLLFYFKTLKKLHLH